ncbi:MAG TPA: RHS repeat-associated core domain-containing protein [Bacteroidales bacterium]|nr:RHS repeat-associated core domain-containing protein [Bacteroidales bacterium]
MIVVFIATNTIANGQQEHYILNTAQSGTQEYIARDYISLKPGFSYSATQGNNFKASINPRLLFEPVGNITGDPGGTVGEIVDNNGVVGAIPGQFNVSPTGAATYSIPIECPAGINGMTPSVSLVYNSQAGNGVAGWGWNIAGFSSITRTQKTVYNDSEAKEIKWDESDVFAIDGARLFIKTKYPYGSTQANADSIEYAKESDYTTKIMAYNFDENGPESFKVWTGDGKKYTYASRMDMSINEESTDYYLCTPYPNVNWNSSTTITRTRTLGWMLTSVSDPFSNQISFVYESELIGGTQYVGDSLFYNWNDPGFQSPIYSGDVSRGFDYYCNITTTSTNTRINHRLKEIVYAGGDYKIEFGYENRNDLIVGYIFGEELKTTKRLSTIKVNYIGGALSTLREYSLIYTNDSYSRLEKVQLTGKNNEKYNYTVFDWSEENYTYNKSDAYSFQNPNHLAQRIAEGYGYPNLVHSPGDFNGDGITDFFVTYGYYKTGSIKYNWAVFLNPGSVSSNLPVLAEGAIPDNRKYYIFDNDLDGKSELYFQYEHTEYTYNEDSTMSWGYPYVKFGGYEYNNGAFSRQTDLDIKIRLWNSNYNDVNLVHTDFEGDGKPDLLLLKNDMSYENSLQFNFGCSSTVFGSSLSYLISDINGNSKQELVFLKTNKIEFWEYEKSNAKFNCKYIYYGANQTDNFFVGDFNGDGNDDILFLDTSQTTWYILASNGNTLFTSTIVPPSLNTYLSSKHDYSIADFNQDGKSDILEARNIWNNGVSTSKEIMLFISKGTSFDLKLTQSNVPNHYLRYCGEADKDFTLDCFAGIGNPFFYSVSKGFGFNQINNITNGTGRYIDISYEKAFYPIGKESLKELPDGSRNITILSTFNKTISKVQEDNNYTFYSFNKPLMHTNGQGFLGFSSINTIDSTVAVKSQSRQHFSIFLEGSKCKLLPDTLTMSINNNAVSSSINYYSSKSLNNTYNVLVDSIVSTDILNDTRQVKKLLSYSNYLLPERIITQNWSHYSKEAETIDSLTYSHNTSNGRWFIGQLTQKRTRQIRPGVSDYARKFDFEYFSTNGALKDEYTQRGTAKEVKKSYVYDNYGNVTSITTVASFDQYDNRSRTSGVIYTADGRFPLTKTDVLQNTESFVYSDETGLLQSQTDINGFVTNYYYDGFGRLKKTIYHDKMEEMASLFWTGDNPSAPSGSTYYSVKQASGSAPVTTYYDKFGKVLRTSTIGLTGNIVNQDKLYDFAQRPWRESLPYFSGSTPLWNTTEYDAYNRVSSLQNADGSFATYSYGVREVSVTSGKTGHTQKTSKKTNSLGETIESIDNGLNKVITRYYASGLPKEMQIDGSTFKTQFTYDIYGNRDTINDPDAGKIVNVYTALGNLKSTKDNKNQVTTYEYDLAGRVTSEQINGVSTVYAYDQSLLGVTNSVNYNNGSNTIYFNYDSGTGQLLSQTETTQQNGVSKALTTWYTYDAFGRMKNQNWSTGYQVSKTYNDKGYLTKISDSGHTLWEATAENALGQITSFNQGSYNTSVAYNEFGDLQGMSTAGVRNMSYGFDDLKNLNFRFDNLTNQKEVFIYDNLNRLTTIEYYHNNSHNSSGDRTMYYDNLGNITGKTKIASQGDINYGEENYGPHALTSIDNASYYPLRQLITYTPFNKIFSITDTLPDNSLRNLVLTYGIDEQRKKTVYTHNSTTITKYFFGDYEEVNNGSTTNKYFFVSSPTGICAIYFIEGANPGKLYYTFTDHLGSLTELVDASTGAVTRQSFDAWGNKRDVSDWTIPATYNLFADRGFTGHEHLEEFELINMNGRVYDPALGRFLSPDPYVQMPDLSQSFNRYSYCINNPLKYTDPSGEFWWMAIGFALMQADIAGNAAKNDGGNYWCGFGKSIGVSAIQVGITLGVGSLVNVIPIGSSPFISALKDGTSAFLSTAINSGINSYAYQNDFNVNWKASAFSGAIAFGLSSLIRTQSISEAERIPNSAGTMKSESYVESYIKNEVGYGEGDWDIRDINLKKPGYLMLDRLKGAWYRIKDGERVYVGGVTKPAYFGGVKISISPNSTMNDLSLHYVARHELIHAFHYFLGLDKIYPNFKSYSDNAAYEDGRLFLRNVPYINNSAGWTKIRLGIIKALENDFPFSNDDFVIPRGLKFYNP